jgi:hypothetical protein
LRRAYYDQPTSKGSQPKIEPPAGIVWWWRGMFCVVFLACSLYAIRNGIRDLLKGWKIYGWGWLGLSFVCAESAVFVLSWGMLW